ncbi:hypothetical protein QTI66_30315 [Variovorax sp. J22R133]|uniref:hypothetical protein n=1 Tax=Variovorax brevis TaxID=3053503 RepID=UPI002575EBC3|nr:hypothetical protein [Variovorax sp. J22R133]MDM0116444.1 hypothetical protein [Variovorax sp. J22R133]
MLYAAAESPHTAASFEAAFVYFGCDAQHEAKLAALDDGTDRVLHLPSNPDEPMPGLHGLACERADGSWACFRFDADKFCTTRAEADAMVALRGACWRTVAFEPGQPPVKPAVQR